jgi:hypothetical protein
MSLPLTRDLVCADYACTAIISSSESESGAESGAHAHRDASEWSKAERDRSRTAWFPSSLSITYGCDRCDPMRCDSFVQRDTFQAAVKRPAAALAVAATLHRPPRCLSLPCDKQRPWNAVASP